MYTTVLLLSQLMTSECSGLRVLNLTGSKVVTDDFLKGVFAANRQLHTVDLSDCHHLTAGCLQSLTVQCKNMERWGLTVGS